MRSWNLAAGLIVLATSAAGAAPKKAPKPPTPAAGSGSGITVDATLGAPPPTIAPGKTPSACAEKILPLVVGNSWTYHPVAAPVPAPDQIARIAPLQPTEIVVTVTAVDKKGTDTVVTLEEKITSELSKDPKKPQPETRKVTSTITCATGKFDISPESVFFAAEPGGMLGLELTKVDRKGTDWKLVNGAIGDAEWREDIAADWNRPATPGSNAVAVTGKLELERVFTPGQPENIITKGGSFKAEHLFLKTTGRVTLGGSAGHTKIELPPEQQKPMELPENWVNSIWLADGIGAVQLLNSYAQMYQLVEAKLN